MPWDQKRNNLIIRFSLEENRARKARVELARNRDRYGRKIYRIIQRI